MSLHHKSTQCSVYRLFVCVCPCVRASLCQSVCLSVCLSLRLCRCLSVLPSCCQFFFLSVCLSVRSCSCLSVLPSCCLSFFLSVCLCLSSCLSLLSVLSRWLRNHRHGNEFDTISGEDPTQLALSVSSCSMKNTMMYQGELTEN